MTYTYAWTNAEQTGLHRKDKNDNVVFIPADPANRDYKEFCDCGATAAPYVAPPQSTDLTVTLTSEQKFERLLKDYNLTKDELVGILNAKKERPAQSQPAQQSPKLDLTGADALLKLDTRALLDLARQNNLQVDEQLLKPENHDALANFLAASLNLLGSSGT